MSVQAHAALFIVVEETGSDVQATLSGDLDVTGMTLAFAGAGATMGNVMASAGNIRFGVTSSVDIYSFPVSNISGGVTNFGTGPFISATSSPDPNFGIMLGAQPTPQLFVPTGFTSGGALNATMIFSNQTLASLGIAAGTINVTLPNDSIVLQLGTAVVSEPTTLAMLALGTTAVLAHRRRKRRGSELAPGA
ncbi:MAG: PEP-CTERM sorting domain-containing protein [Pseudomonadota bacterium]